jgi:WD40 repeat protein
MYFEFNAVVLKACENNPLNRYQSAVELREDLMLLRAGKSVRRLRLVERRLKILTRAGAIGAVLALASYFHFSQQRKLAMQNVANSYVAYGTRLLDQHDLLGALPSYAAALALEKNDDRRANQYRLHLGVSLHQSPKLVQMWFFPGAANSVEFSPSGDRLVVSGASGRSLVYKPDRDEPEAELRGHAPDAYVEYAAFSPDGRLIVTASEDGTARVWESDSGHEVSSLSPLKHRKLGWDQAANANSPPLALASVFCARFSPRGDTIVTGCEDGGVRLWDLGNPERPRATLQAHTDAVLYVAFSPDGKTIVTCSRDFTARLWDALTLQPLHEKPMTHLNWVYGASFSPDGKQVVTASFDRAVCLWEVNTGALIDRFEPRVPVCSVQYSPDGTYIAAACWDYDSTARIWEVGAGKEASFLLRHTGYPIRVAYAPDGHRVAVAGVDGVIRLWDLAGNTSEAPTSPTVFSTDGRHQALVHDQRFEIRNLGGGQAEIPPLTIDGSAAGAVVSPDGRSLLTASLAQDGSSLRAQLWSMQNDQPLGPAFSLTEDHVRGVLSPDGTRFFAAAGNTVEIWDTLKAERLHVLSHSDPLNGIACSPRANRISTWGGKNAFLWKSADGAKVSEMSHPSTVGHAEFSPDGLYLVTSCAAGQLNKRFAELWDGESGRALGIRLWHDDGVSDASFSPDGRRVVTASEDRTARIWDRASGEQLTPPLVHRDRVSKARFSPDGRWVVTLCGDRSARVWGAATGLPVTPALQHSFEVVHVQFIEDGKRIFCSSHEPNSLGRDFQWQDWRLWDLTPDSRPSDQLTLMAEVLSGRRGGELGAGLQMEQKALKAAWRALRESQAADFKVSPEEIRTWHQREARSAESAKRWFAARFHLSRLAQLLPNDPDIARRLARAEMSRASDANGTP